MIAQKNKEQHLIARQHVEVVNDWGLHARPAATIASIAAQYHDCEITLRLSNQSATALSVAAILMLEAVKGSNVEVIAQGSQNAPAAVKDIVKVIQQGFGEQHRVLKGEGISCSIAIGSAHVLLSEPDDIPHYSISNQKIADERKRHRAAVSTVKAEFTRLGVDQVDSQIAEFRQLLLQMLNEECFTKQPAALIRQQLVNAEWALKVCVGKITEQFTDRSNPIWQSRAEEYSLILMRLLSAMAVETPKSKKTGANRIIVASDIGPAEVIEYHRAGYTGFVSSGGSSSSHAAIVARSMGLPAILAIEKINLEAIEEDMLLAIDSDVGELHILPTKEKIADLRKKARSDKDDSAQPVPRVGSPPLSLSRDGERIHIYANIDFLAEIDIAKQAGAEGVGLFRTEFMSLGQDTPPDEDEQLKIYSEVLHRFAPLPVTFRTLDIGYDKQLSSEHETSSSPLGMRAIRYSLQEPDQFKVQLRALLRASQVGSNMKIMLPMIGHEHELASAYVLLQEAASELGMQDTKLPDLGAMIEIPGTAYIMESLAKQSSFFSVGTNDLLQYTLAVDRNNAKLASLSNPAHPGFLALLGHIIATANQLNISITVCGELASDPTMVRFLVSLGLRELSMNPLQIAPIRENLRSFRIVRHQQIALQVVKCRSTEQAAELLTKFNDSTI